MCSSASSGPRLAASDETQVPTPLRRGDRALGGSLSWSKPQALGSFSENSPYAGLTVPGDVTVNRQVLAEPGLDLADRTWASLSDGTPLVTAARVGAGWLVLFHVTADTRWSNLPISGAFVEMLRRTVALGSAARSARDVGGSAMLPPLSLLDGYGRPTAPTAGVTGIREADIATARPSRSTPPGLYGSDDGFRALNPLRPDMTYMPPDLSSLPGSIRRTGLVTEAAIDLSPFGFGLSFLLLLIDGLAVTALAGGFRRRRSATAAIVIGIGLALLLMPPTARAGRRRAPSGSAVLHPARLCRDRHRRYRRNQPHRPFGRFPASSPITRRWSRANRWPLIRSMTNSRCSR